MNNNLLMMRGLSLDRLQTFCSVADAGGISKAAGGDPAKQSLYSRQIRELQEFFGVELTRRQGKGIVLTEAGTRLARLIREQFVALAEFQRTCKEQPADLTIAAGNSVLEWVVAPVLHVICKGMPKTHIVLLNQRSDDVIASIREFKADLGIVGEDAVISPLEHRPLVELGYSLFVPIGLCKGMSEKQISADLSKIPLALPVGGRLRQRLELVARKQGRSLNVKVSCSTFGQALGALESGRFAAVLPAWAGKKLGRDQYRFVNPPFFKDLARQLKLVWHPRLAAIRPVVAQAVDRVADAIRG